MRIAQISPLYESLPPKGYGGTERVVHFLTEELVRLGHQVTVFASGDSKTSAELIAPCPRALRTDANCIDQLIPHFRMLEEVCRQAGRFDFIHFHVDYLHFPFTRRKPHPHVTTLHGRLDLPELPSLYREYPDMPVVSISNAQRRPLPRLNWKATVYHGLPENLFTFRAEPGKYLAFLGRISRDKRLDRAIDLAERVGLPLKVAAKIDKNDRDYFEAEIKHLLRKPHVEYIGEIGGKEKDAFLGNALALLFLIDWPEPFGLVMTEAMACGVPTIAWRCGSVPEVLEEGVTGYIVESMDQAVQAVGRLAAFDRRRCRQEFERRFSVRRMAQDYLAVYRNILDQGTNRGAGDGMKDRSRRLRELATGEVLPIPTIPASGRP
jgi:glycosyltransferase involved in cell wall biosynthesis